MKLDLRFSNRPLDELWCQAVTALVFMNPDMEFGVIARLNEKLSGYLKELIVKGMWKGARGERLLLASQSAIRADKIFLYGLGNIDDYEGSFFMDDLSVAGKTLDKMGLNEFGLYIPCMKGLEHEYDRILENSLRKLIDIFINNHGDDHEFLLKIIVSVENELMDMLSRVEIGLREYFTPMMEYSLIIENSQDAGLHEDAA